MKLYFLFFFFFQAEDGIRDGHVTGVQTCALPISRAGRTVLFGGTDEASPGHYTNETWELEPGIVTPPGAPAISFNATNQGFGAQTVGATSAASIWITSSGTGPLLIDSISTTGDSTRAANACPNAPDSIAHR